MPPDCPLRSPQRQVSELFPDATDFRTVSGRVDLAARARIEAQLGSRIELSDLGAATVYIVQRDGVPIGFVHARTDIGRRGVTELAWAFDLNLRVRRPQVQRSRELAIDVLRGDPFLALVLGRDWCALKALLAAAPDELAVETPDIDAEGRPLAAAAVRSALMAALVVEHAFGDETRTARVQGNAAHFFPERARVEEVELGVDRERRTAEALGRPAASLALDSMRAHRAVDAQGEHLGLLVVARVAAADHGAQLWLAVRPDGRLGEVVACGAPRTTDFAALRGRGLDDLRSDPDTAARAGAEALALLKASGALAD